MKLKLEEIRLEHDLQPRAEINSETVQEYADAMREGVQFPPVTVYRNGDGYSLADGWHRVMAATAAGLAEIEAEVKQGTRRDALLAAVTANITHGLRRTNADKRRAVLVLLNDPEWRKWSDHEIARQVGVSQPLVTSIRGRLSDNRYQIESRTVQRGDSVYTMQTENIGHHVPEPRQSAEIDETEEDFDEENEKGCSTCKHCIHVLHGIGFICTLHETALPDDLDCRPCDLEDWEPEEEEIPEASEPEHSRPQFNRTNDNIEWAAWSWNPVTGCEHDCIYCYARDIAQRFYAEGFKPTYHPDRLEAPRNTNPLVGNPGGNKVFVCSMADLFGVWVPEEWINGVMQAVRDNPQWTFIFLTKNPRRLALIQFPVNSWVGTTVDTQARVMSAEKAMADVKASVKFVSCEPMLEPLKFSNLSIFQWVIIGGQSQTSRALEFQPEFHWVLDLTEQAWQAKCKVYWKPNLKSRPREYPA